jgi:aspartate aminotransferase
MMRHLSDTVTRIPESQTIALTATARRLAEAGVDVISLTAGEPDVPPAPHVKAAAVEAVGANSSRYAPNEGIHELLEAIRWKFSTCNHLSFGMDQILVSSGAKQSIFNALLAVCGPGDEAIIVAPYWVSYPAMVRLTGAMPVVVKTRMEEGFLPDPELLRASIRSHTKALILNSPGNPSGRVYPTSLLEEIAGIVRETGIYLISDEIYERVVYDGRTHVSIGSLEGMSEQVVTVSGLSKAHAMPGWRIGYMGGPAPVVSAAARVQSQTTGHANTIAQRAAVAALRGPQQSVEAMVAAFQHRRDRVSEMLAREPKITTITPDGAIYFFLRITPFLGRRHNGNLVRSSDDLAHYLLAEHHVAVVPGSAFGDDDCLRLSFSVPEETLLNGVKRILEGLGQLR